MMKEALKGLWWTCACVLISPLVAAAAPTPYTGSPLAIPGTIKIEQFDNGGEGVSFHDTTPQNFGGAARQTAVDLEASNEGGFNVGWTTAGEWLLYTVNVANAGNYSVDMRVASGGRGGTFHLEANGANVSGPVSIPDTSDWQIFRTISTNVSLQKGTQQLRVVFDSNGVDGSGNISWLRFNAAAGSTPYTGTPITLPGTFASVNFDNGGEGVGYHDTTGSNEGGAYRQTGVDIERSTLGAFNIGWTEPGEWLAYSVNVQTAGSYLVTLRTATPVTTGRMHLTSGGSTSATVSVNRSSDWQIWTSTAVPITLAAGPQTLKIVVDAGDFNIADVSVALTGSGSPSSPSSPAPPPSSGTSTGNVINVPANGDLQSAINNARPGDTILLAAGATYVGNYTLPAKSGSGVITIRTSAPDGSLPNANTRITPAYASLLPKLRSPNAMAALATERGAHDYRIQAVEFLSTNQGLYDIIALGDGSSAQRSSSDVPQNLVLDRVYIHGDPRYGQKRAIALNSGATTIANSWIAEIKGSGGQDSQAIGGWNGPGPYDIVNNYIEAAGENIMFGGADPFISQLVPSNITIRRNHITKQLAWRTQGLVVKNLLELKNAQNVVIDSNIFENHWAESQQGFAVVLTPRNQEGGAPWAVVQNVQFVNNIVQHVSAGINLLGTDYTHPSQLTRNIIVRNNLFDDLSRASYGGPGEFMLFNGGSDIVIDHNTIRNDGPTTMFADGDRTFGVTMTSNIFQDNQWALIGSGTAPGSGTAAQYFPGATILNNAWVGSNASSYPGGNFFPASMSAVGFVNLGAGDLRLAVGSLFYRAGLDGKDVGADIAAIMAATAGVKQ